MTCNGLLFFITDSVHTQNKIYRNVIFKTCYINMGRLHLGQTTWAKQNTFGTEKYYAWAKKLIGGFGPNHAMIRLILFGLTITGP